MKSDQSNLDPIVYGVLPFVREADGRLRPMKPLPTENQASANYRAASGVRAGVYEGAIAFVRRERRSSGFETRILGRYGEVPEERGEGDETF